MRNDFESNYLAHFGLKKGAQKDKHKYFARVELGEKNGKMQYRYFYSLKEYAAYMKDKAKEKIDDFNQNKEKIMADKINKGVAKLEELYNKLDTQNKYMTDDYNYDQKIEQVKKTKEWQDIVKRKDPEYVYKNKEGQTVYDVDSYLSKKKHPVLDVADDIVSGRNVTMNKIERDSTVAGAADYAKTYVTLAALGTKFLLEKFKFSQGSYKEEKQAAIDYASENKDKIIKTAEMANAASSDPRVMQAISDGEKYINQYAKEVQNLDVDSIQKQTNISKEDYEQIKRDYDAVVKELERTKAEASQTANKTAKTKSQVQKVAKASVNAAEMAASKKSEDTKYVKKVKLPSGEYRYFYTQDEYDAYLRDEDTKKKKRKDYEK